MPRWLAMLLALIVVALPSPGFAAGNAPVASWVSLGFGRGVPPERADNELLAASAIVLGGSVQRSQDIFSFRYSRLGWDVATGDIALLYERGVLRRRVRVTVGVGAGLLYRNNHFREEPLPVAKHAAETTGTYDRAGAAWHVELTSNSSRDVRGGLAAFGSVAGEASFWGLALVLHLGDLGPPRGNGDP